MLFVIYAVIRGPIVIVDFDNQTLNLEPLFISDSRKLSPIAKIIQSLILIQNTEKRDWIGGDEIFGALFFKKVPLFANIGCSLNFLG